MLSLFPGLLFLSPLALTLARVASALVLGYVTYIHLTNRGEATHELKPLLKSFASPLLSIGIAIEIVIAITLFLGYMSQLAALLALLGGIKLLVLKRYYKIISPLSRSTYALFVVLCIITLLSGAGAYAFDLPL